MNEVETRCEVAPLVTPARLQRAAVPAVELEEVEPLQDLVAELRIADPDVGVQPGADGIFRQHLVHPEMPADIAQQFDGGKVRRPIEVIHHHRWLSRTSPAEIEEWRDLTFDLLDPIRDGLRVIELALGVLLRIPDQARRTTDERERTVPGVLKSPQHEDLDQVSQVQAGGGRIEAAVERDRSLVERSTKRAEVRAHRNQAAPREVIEEMGGLGHARILAHRPCQRSDGLAGRRFSTCAR